MDIQITITQMPAFAENPGLVTELVDRIFGAAAHEALLHIANTLAADVPRDTGELGLSFQEDPADDTGGIEFTGHFASDGPVDRVFSELPYAAAMDQGRRPGAPIGHAGLEAIALWAERKLGLSSEEAERAKWAIAAKIVRDGIPPHHFMDAATAEAQSGIETIFSQAAEDLVDALSAPGK